MNIKDIPISDRKLVETEEEILVLFKAKGFSTVSKNDLYKPTDGTNVVAFVVENGFTKLYINGCEVDDTVSIDTMEQIASQIAYGSTHLEPTNTYKVILRVDNRK